MTAIDDARTLIAAHIRTGAPRSITVAEMQTLLTTIADAIEDRSATTHAHDDRYYTEAEVASLLAAKVAITAIVDNLTSTDSAAPLSAAQGRNLKTLIDNLSNVTTGLVVSGTDVAVGETPPTWRFEVQENSDITVAQFGVTSPLYIMRSYPAFGFNAYYNGGYLAKSAGYCATEIFNTSTGDWTFASTAASVAAGGVPTLVTRWKVTAAGFIGIGVTPTEHLHVGGNIKAAGYLELAESPAPSVPAASNIRLFAVDDGGVTRAAYVDDAGVTRYLGSPREGVAIGASGTAVDFTGIPPGTKRIVLTFANLSLSGDDLFLVQIGDSGGVETTGYISSGVSASTAVTSASYSYGFGLTYGNNGSSVLHGAITLTRADATSHLWVATSVGCFSAGASGMFSGGAKALSGELDRIRITSQNGVVVFDSGTINIAYE